MPPRREAQTSSQGSPSRRQHSSSWGQPSYSQSSARQSQSPQADPSSSLSRGFSHFNATISNSRGVPFGDDPQPSSSSRATSGTRDPSNSTAFQSSWMPPKITWWDDIPHVGASKAARRNALSGPAGKAPSTPPPKPSTSSASFWDRATTVQEKALDLIDEARFKRKLKEFQRIVDGETEVPQKAKVIHVINSMCAYHKSGIALRFPKHHPWCEYMFFDKVVWSSSDVSTFHETGKLPISFASFTEDPSDGMCLWVIDASPSAPAEVELDPLPDFDERPAICLFDCGEKGRVQLVPSEFLDVVIKGARKVQFVVKEEFGEWLRERTGDVGGWEGVLDLRDIEVAGRRS